MATPPKKTPNQPTLVTDPPRKFSQGLSDVGYRRKYGNNPEAAKARIRAIMQHRGLSPTEGRIADIYKRRGKEFQSGYAGLREDVMGIPGATAPAKAGGKHLDLTEIRAALDAISAGFGLQRQQLANQRGATQRGFSVLDERLGRDRGDALTGVKSGAAGQGLLRSGLYLQDVGDIGEAFAQERTAALGERDARLRAIAQSLAGIKSLEASKRAAVARQMARSQVGPKGDIARALELV